MEKPLNSVFLQPTFMRKSKAILSDDEISDLTAYLAEPPDSGDLVPDTGGIRKVK